VRQDILERLRSALTDRYAIEEEIGHGGMATVLRARDLKHQRNVALKVLHPELATAVGPDRFLREIQIAAQLNHPHLVPLFDSGTTDGQLWYVMPLVEGESLRARLLREGQLPLDDSLSIARDIAGAMGFAHSRGIIHRDIKPENILLAGGHALLTDLGIARAVGAEGESLTETGMIVGTPGYMSPEQGAGNRAIDARSDIYSLASVLYEMLAGEPPFTGPTHLAITAKQLQGGVPSVRVMRQTVPQRLDRALAKALAKVPADRFATAGEFAAALGTPSDSAAEGAAVERSGPLPWKGILVTAALLSVLAVAGFLARPSSARNSKPVASSAANPIRLAVLPFASLSSDPADAFFADGVTEEIGTALGRIPGLSVIARTSVTRYRDRPLADLARDLNVANVVEGSVRKAGNRTRVTVKLVEAHSESSTWSADYDGTVGDLLAVQSEVARQVAEHLRTTVGGGRPKAKPVANPQAYEAYLRAMYRWHVVDSKANNDSAISLLERVVALDPGFAEAHSALGAAYVGRLFNYDPDRKWLERAYVELAHALALDSGLASAYLVRSNIAYTEAEGWKIEAAIRDSRRAIALDPSSATAHNGLGALYLHVGLLDDARHEFAIAQDLDPLEQFAAPRIARTFWYRQQFDSGLAWLNRAPGFEDERALVLNYLGRTATAAALLDSVLLRNRIRSRADLLGPKAVLLAAEGKRQEVERIIREATASRSAVSHFHHAQYTFAMAYALLGDRRRALELLRNTANNGMPCYPLFAGDPNLKNLRGDPEFAAFLEEQRIQWERYRKLAQEPLGPAPKS
jgi:serine/threonine-protein kinase